MISMMIAVYWLTLNMCSIFKIFEKVIINNHNYYIINNSCNNNYITTLYFIADIKQFCPVICVAK